VASIDDLGNLAAIDTAYKLTRYGPTGSMSSQFSVPQISGATSMAFRPGSSSILDVTAGGKLFSVDLDAQQVTGFVDIAYASGDANAGRNPYSIGITGPGGAGAGSNLVLVDLKDAQTQYFAT